jgi:hypothetical protein
MVVMTQTLKKHGLVWSDLIMPSMEETIALAPGTVKKEPEFQWPRRFS